MSQSFLTEFSVRVAGLINMIGKNEFTNELAAMFKSLIPTNNVMVICYPRKQLPSIAYNDTPPTGRMSTVEQYIKGAFLLDPFYIAANKNKLSGFHHLCDIAPEHFERSEYKLSYFNRTKLSDECGYIIQYGEEGEAFIVVSLGQSDQDKPYSESDLSNMDAISPIIDSLVRQHWQSSEDETDMQMDMRAQLETALTSFGTSILTDRENQTVQMILHGYANRAIAERLDISIETVKLHRKNAYAKLDLGTQGELFNLFINSLINIENYSGGDPLISYFDVAKTPG
jgi:DNA-binding CsgD family transcriptional regulator